jgi:TonB-linked SusC/RagA family outer membrane protein
MKCTTTILIIVLVHTSSTAVSQITLHERNAPLEKVITAIEKQTIYVFLYDPEELKTPPITISIKNATLLQTLTKCFEGQSIEFTIVGNNVLLKKAPQQNPPPTSPIHGKVFDESGQPMQGVTISNKRTTTTTQTDTTGAYTIPGTKGDALAFTFVGYTPRETTIAAQPAINVTLEPNPANPDQVVVVGYGSSKKKDLTGAISVIDLKNKEELSFNTIDNLLAGQAAGVQVTKDDGTPGGMVRIRIRGLSSLLGGVDPLYVIDGIPVQVRNNFIDPGFRLGSPASNLIGTNSTGIALQASFVNSLNSLGGVDPADIASVTVLKDASSTAIYGSKATNGVVIITTRTGKTDTPPQITVDYSSTVSTIYRRPKLLNASQYKTLLTEAANNCIITAGLGQTGTYPYVKAIVDTPGYFGTATTDWIKQVTRTTIGHNVGVSVSGGSLTSKYFSSFRYENSPGVLAATGNQRITGKLTLETVIHSKFKFTSNFLVGSTDQAIADGAYLQAQLARPDWTPRDPAGNYTNFDLPEQDAEQFINPVALLTATNTARTLSLLGSLTGAYDLTKRIHFRTAVSLNAQQYNQRNFVPHYINLQGDYSSISNPRGIGSEANSRFADWFLENTLSYDQQFNGKHTLNIVLGQSWETTKYSFSRATGAGYANDNFLNALSSADSVVGIAGDESRSPQSYLLSFYARTNYSYKDKYLLTFTGRADGSSKFGPDNKYGYFPSGAIAWRFSNEDFLKKIRWINEGKLRASYGLTGNQNIGDQMYRTLYTNVSYAASGALIPVQLGNSGIKWETTRQADIGVDLSLLRNRINLTADYYNRQTNGALLTLPVAPSTSYVSLLQNAVGLRNRGWELTIGGDLVRTKNFKWSASVNAAWNSSVVTRIDTNANINQLVSPSGLEYPAGIGNVISTTNVLPGKPLGSLTGQIITGIIRTQAQLDQYNMQLGDNAQNPVRQIGDPIYRLDQRTASQGFRLVATNQVIGNGPPKAFGGMTQEFSYRNFGLHCYFAFSLGGHLLWIEHVASTEFYATANAGTSMLDRYTPENTGTEHPKLDLTADYTPTNLDVFSSSYLKLRSLTVDYRWKNMQFFASATNVFTITKYPGSDPETSDDPYFVGGGYIDAGLYPAVRTFSLGVKAVFK